MTGINIPSRKQRPKDGRRVDFPRLLGGNLCLNFVNTVERRISPQPEEFLRTYEDVVHWGEHVSLLKPNQSAVLLQHAKKLPDEAAICLKKAIELREVLYRIFLAQTRNMRPPQDDLNFLKQMYLQAVEHAEFSPMPQGYRWQWHADEPALDQILWHVAYAAVELLSSTDVERVKECHGANDCGWLFFDESKNLSRRWCSMEGCGSRVKARRQYARKRSV